MFLTHPPVAGPGARASPGLPAYPVALRPGPCEAGARPKMATLPKTLATTGRHAAPALVLATALVATGLSYLSARTVAEGQAARRFSEVGFGAAHDLSRRMDAYVLMLRSAAGLADALGRAPTQAEFHAHFGALDPTSQFQGIQGIGWVHPMRPEEVEAHEHAVRARGRPDYRVWPPAQGDLATSIVLLEPLDWRNQRALGFDMYSEPVRREAMARSRDTGLPAASGKVELVQEVGASRQAGFLVYLPVYLPGPRPLTVEERRERLLGWVYAPFRAGDLLKGTIDVEAVQGLRLDVHDGVDQSPPSLLASVGDLRGGEPVRLQATRVDVEGRTWTLRLLASEAFLQPAEQQLPRIVAGVSAAIALLIFWLTWRETQARARAERVAVRNAFLAEIGRAHV